MKSNTRRRLGRAAYCAAQWTWGLPQTLLGAGLYFAHRKDEHFDYNGARATVWDRGAGISLGRFIFLPRGDTEAEKPVSSFLLDHEYGHTLQSLILGPAYLPLVGLPSIAWNRLPYFARMRKKTGRSYYSAVFERTASELGEKAAASRCSKGL